MELQKIKEFLPHGAMTEIANKVGVSKSEISRIFAGLKTKKHTEVLEAIAEYLAEHKAKERKAVQAINEALNPDTTETPKQFSFRRMNYQREKYGEGSSPLL